MQGQRRRVGYSDVNKLADKLLGAVEDHNLVAPRPPGQLTGIAPRRCFMTGLLLSPGLSIAQPVANTPTRREIVAQNGVSQQQAAGL